MNQDFMVKKKILPLVLSMSYPMVLSMLVNSLYNIVDSYFVAKISENAMTALALVYPLQNVEHSVAVGFGIGINAAAAFFLGAGQRKRADNAVSQGIILGGVHGLILTVVCIAVMPSFLRLFTSDSEVIQYGIIYSNVVFGFSIVQNIAITFEKIFQAVGKMKVSMVSMLIGCITNIILDPIFIFGIGPVPAMGVKGAAIATGIGQAVTCLVYLIVFIGFKQPVSFKVHRTLFKDDVYKRLYAVGIPATLNMGLPSLLITMLNGILAEFSQVYVLILGIYYKLQTFIYLTANGVIQGIRPIISFNYGAGRRDRVLGITKTSLMLCAGIMAFGTVLCLAIPNVLMGMFSQTPETIAEGAAALRIISAGFIVSAVSVVISGVYEALGEGIPSLVISIIRYIVIAGIAYLISRFAGAAGVWNAFWITEVIAAAVSAAMFARRLQK